MRLLLACRGGCVETNIETITVGVGDGHSGGMCDGAHRGSERPRSRGVSDGNCGASRGALCLCRGFEFRPRLSCERWRCDLRRRFGDEEGFAGVEADGEFRYEYRVVARCTAWIYGHARR